MVSKLYINLVPIVSGGGLQNAINFLLNLDLDKLNFNKTIVIIRNNAVLQKICNDNSYEYIVIDNTFFARLKYEIFFFMDKKSSILGHILTGSIGCLLGGAVVLGRAAWKRKSVKVPTAWAVKNGERRCLKPLNTSGELEV